MVSKDYRDEERVEKRFSELKVLIAESHIGSLELSSGVEKSIKGIFLKVS